MAHGYHHCEIFSPDEDFSRALSGSRFYQLGLVKASQRRLCNRVITVIVLSC